MNKGIKKTLEILAASSLGLFFFGSILGLESNLKPLSQTRIQDTSFNRYLEKGKEQIGDNIGTYSWALITYPGARLGAEIHNYDLPENP